MDKLEELMKRKEEYRINILKLVQDSSTQKVAYHFNCPDGIISATLINYLFSTSNLIFIPIDYPLLKDKMVKENLDKANWFAILDLSPFNVKEIEFFFDHHISNIGFNIKAKKHVFNPKAPSAASLIAQFFVDKLPNYLKELADITEITDTASYKTPPPLNLKGNFEDLDWNNKVWLVEDVCKSAYTIEEHNQLIRIFTDSGLKGVWGDQILNRVKILRQTRKEAFDVVEGIKMKDFIIIIDDPLHYNTAFIAREVMKRGAIGAAYITVNPDDVKISLRLSKTLRPDEVEKYRVDLLAKQMDGGGHKGASGAELKDLDQTLDKILLWTKKMNLQAETLDLREK